MRTLAPTFLLVAAMLAPAASALPTPGVFCDVSDLALGRLFPEAMETNDFVSYDEAKCGLETLVAQHPEWIAIDVVGQSVGWDALAGGRDTFDVFVVRVTNGESATPAEDKIRIVFQLSIHGNEKGGREGGLRVIEDLVRDIGHAKEHPEMRQYLDYMELLFVFPNPDGWTHEEAHYRHNDACYFSVTNRCGEAGVETQSFVRVNGNGVDVNREWPTVGWVRERYTPMSEPEAIALVNYLKGVGNVKYASDIHGMLNPADGGPGDLCGLGEVPPEVDGFDPTCFASAVTGAKGHFVLTMLPAGRQDPKEMLTNTALAELIKERLNANPTFAEWQALPNSAGGAWGGKFNDWGTVWDTIGYTDSGFTSDWYAQDTGLNAAGVDFELSYNHITFDNYYPGVAQRMNAYHVEIVREIVRAFMDQANLDTEVSVDAKGTRTAFLDNPTVVTNADRMEVSGWAKENAADDAFDAAHKAYRAAPNDYFLDVQQRLRDGADQRGVLDALRPADLTAQRLAQYDNLLVAGSAWKIIADSASAQAAVKAWVEQGGNLVLTDEALRMLVPLGVVPEGSVDVHMGYAGATNFVDREHPLAQGIRGLARETYEPVPLGFGVDGLNAPNWFVKADAFQGEVVGVAGQGQGASPDPSMVNFGQATVGSGTVRFLGSLLPDPTDETNAWYGVDSYATTYTGNQLLRNMLGWDNVFAQTPVAPEQLGQQRDLAGAAATQDEPAAAVPAPGLLGVLALAGALALLRRRK